MEEEGPEAHPRPFRRLALASSAAAQTSVPQQLAYEGLLSNLSGVPSSGTHSLQFAIWPASTGGTTPLWSDTLSVAVVNGLYSVTLGTTVGDPLPPTLFDGSVRFLEISVDLDVLSPRQAIGSVPYSLLSAGVQGGPVNATSIAVNGIPIVNAAGHTIVGFSALGGAPTAVTSVSGLFCGASGTSTTGLIEEPDSGIAGYRATKLLCQGICGSVTAHMCSGAELVRSVELGVSLPSSSLWYSSGVSLNVAGYQWNDCGGWTDGLPLGDGQVFLGSGLDGGNSPSGDPNATICNNTHPMACCD